MNFCVNAEWRSEGLHIVLVTPALVLGVCEEIHVAAAVEVVGTDHPVFVLKGWRWLSELRVLQKALRILRQNTKSRHFWKCLIFREQGTESVSFTRAKDIVCVVEERCASG